MRLRPRFAFACFPQLLLLWTQNVGLHAAPAPGVSPVKPLQTELIAPLDLSRLRVGSPVLVRVDVEWSVPGCTLRPGSMVQGHVIEVGKRTKSVRNSEVQLVFDAADCESHHENFFLFTLAALVGSDGTSAGRSGMIEAQPLADAVGNAIGGASGIRSAQTASEINSTFSLPMRTLPNHILPGQVIGVRKTTLTIGSGVDGATTITALGHDVRLEQGTSLVLIHNVIAVVKAPAANAISTADKTVSSVTDGASPSATEPSDETELCVGACTTVDSMANETKVQDSSAEASLTLKKLGYSPRENREVIAFDEETTLTYLDADNLLCTFDPHQLRERAGSSEEAVRRVRAVLIDPHTHMIKQVMEWRVRGDEQYLWRLAAGRVLVHMGNELRVLDARLLPIRSIHVEGKVAWVVSSPAGGHIAVGTIRERYSESVKRDLEAVLPGEAEEDVNVQVFDQNYKIILTALRSSKMPAPVLSDAGELRVHGDGHTHWKITEYRWDRTEHTIAATRSGCRPSLSTPQSDLIFAVGCTASGAHWYRMLRPDGHPLLKGESPSNEIQMYAEGTQGGAFAIRVVKTAVAMSYGQPFKKSDLTQQLIALYRTSDGANLAIVATTDFALSQMAFALSPSGDQMALLGNKSVSFFAISLKKTEPFSRMLRSAP
jgi:hypothetical protein